MWGFAVYSYENVLLTHMSRLSSKLYLCFRKGWVTITDLERKNLLPVLTFRSGRIFSGFHLFSQQEHSSTALETRDTSCGNVLRSFKSFAEKEVLSSICIFISSRGFVRRKRILYECVNYLSHMK